jgi:hypothetical protein
VARPVQPHVNISADKLAFIILKACQFDVKENGSNPDEGSSPNDDGTTDVLTDKSDDPVRAELLGEIRDLPEDERFQLVALARLGRGTCDLSEWRTALDTARGEHKKRAAEYLLGLSLLGDYLEDGWALFDDGMADDAGAGVGRDSRSEAHGPAHGKIRRRR